MRILRVHCIHKDAIADHTLDKRPVLDDRLSASIYDLQSWSQGSRGTKKPMPWDALYGMHRDGIVPKIYLLRGDTGFRLAVDGGHDFLALRVPAEKRKPPSPKPYGAGEEVAPWDLPQHVVMAIPHIVACGELHQGLWARDSWEPTFILHASTLTEEPPALWSENPDALAWVNTLQASLGGVRFFHAPCVQGDTKPDWKIFWSSGCIGRLPAESVARVCPRPAKSTAASSSGATWNHGHPASRTVQYAGQRTSLTPATQ